MSKGKGFLGVVVGAVLAVATGGLAALAAGAAFTTSMAVSTFAGSLILGGLSMALTPKPKSSGAGSYDISNYASPINKTTIALKQPDLTRQYVYGHTRMTRGYAHIESTGLNGDLHIIIILCDGPLRAINEIWLNDYSIPNDWIDGNGNVTQGRYAGKLIIRKHLGTTGQAADSLAVSNMADWTSNHTLSGMAYLYMVLTKDQDVYPTGVPNISAIVEGPHIYDPRTRENTWSTNIALYCHDFLRNDKYGFGALSVDIDETNIAAQANICDEIVTTTDVSKTVASIDVSSNIFTLDGDLLGFEFGDRVRVASTGSLPSGLTNEGEYYVIPYQIRTTPRILLASSLEDSMAKIAIDITGSGSGTISIIKNGEPRYHGSGVIDSATPLSATMSDLVTSMAGRAINIGGFWTLLAGAWRAPIISFGISDMRGSGIGVRNCLSISESFNSVKGVFVSSLNDYQPSDYPSAMYPEFVAQDNGVEAARELNLPFTNRPTTAQRIAKIELFRGRQDIVFTSDFSTRGLLVQPGDVVNINIDRLGWENKPFEITEFTFDVNNGSIMTKMTLRETAQEIYDWSMGEAIAYDPAPNTNLPNPFIVQAVSGLSYNSRVIETRDGDEIYSLTLNWDTHPDQFVINDGKFEIQYKLSADSDWRPSFFVDGRVTTTDVLTSSVNVPYDIRIRAHNNLGVRSSWNVLEGVVVGSSGGISETRDYEYVDDAVVYDYDYGSVEDEPDEFEDWGFVV